MVLDAGKPTMSLASLLALDDAALACARDLAARGPRCDFTIQQLPALALPVPGDLLPVYHNGQTYQVTLATLQAAGVLPVYTAAGIPVAVTKHIVQDKVTAAGVTVSIVFGGSAVFTSATSYSLYIFDETSFLVVVPTAKSATGFSFSSTNGHVYSFLANGT